MELTHFDFQRYRDLLLDVGIRSEEAIKGMWDGRPSDDMYEPGIRWAAEETLKAFPSIGEKDVEEEDRPVVLIMPHPIRINMN